MSVPRSLQHIGGIGSKSIFSHGPSVAEPPTNLTKSLNRQIDTFKRGLKRGSETLWWFLFSFLSACFSLTFFFLVVHRRSFLWAWLYSSVLLFCLCSKCTKWSLASLEPFCLPWSHHISVLWALAIETWLTQHPRHKRSWLTQVYPGKTS